MQVKIKIDIAYFSLCFNLAAAIILSYGMLCKSVQAIKDLSSTYLDSNPFAFKDYIFSTYEIRTGFLLLIVAIACQIYGINKSKFLLELDSTLVKKIGYFISIVLLALLISILSIKISHVVAKSIAFPILKEDMKDLYERDSFFIKNDGLTPGEFADSNKAKIVKKETKDKRLVDAHKNIEMIERLFELHSKGEWNQRIEKLEKFYKKD